MRLDGRFDAASALLQVGIVIASAAIITGTVMLVWVGAALGGAGALLSLATFLGLA
jgi:membrane protein implicated in regulation of membrane protease activity